MVVNIMSKFLFYLNPWCVRPLRSLSVHVRCKSGLALWDSDLTREIKIAVENNWKDEVLSQQSRKDGEVRYILSMFPYPSGQLHMGHVRVYSISDTIARFFKLHGMKVIHPMGWDAFGLPAENAALERNVLPDHWTSSNIATMKKQLLELGFHFDWDREVTTCKEDYYKWTQFIFIKLFEQGLVYRTKAEVNWDPLDKTVLADEQVDDTGCSWRSGAKVEKKLLNQWYIKTTTFAKSLFDGLDDESLVDWKDIINLQKHWIGECNGMVVRFALKSPEKLPVDSLDVWTSAPQKFLHSKFLILTSNNLLCTSKTTEEGTVLPFVAVNPISGVELPLMVLNDFDYPEGRDIYVASPSICKDDKELAQRLGLAYDEDITNVNIVESKNHVIESVNKFRCGVYPVSSKLRDWLISRQRYWGTPIPIIHCEICGTVPVPYSELPVKLPKVQSITPGNSPMSENKDWLNCPCPKCGLPAKRETDTMDTFVDSSWYFLRYLDSINKDLPFNKQAVKSSFPVDLYIGGKEHAVLHLYYARFITHFLHSLGWVPQSEPFKKLLVHGMVMGRSYRVSTTGKYIPKQQVRYVDKKAFDAVSGEIVETHWEKMSKSKHNGENPHNVLKEYGCDTTRLFMLSDFTPASHRHWSDETFPGILNWQHRLWLTVRNFIKNRQDESLQVSNTEEFKKHEEKLSESRNYFISETTYHYKYTHHLSIAISRLQGFTNVLRRCSPEVVAKSGEYERSLCALTVMLSPVAPHFCCEMWSGLQCAPNRIDTDGGSSIDWSANVLEQNWPKVDDNHKLTVVCKVDGAKKFEMKMIPQELAALDHQAAVQMALNQKHVAKRVQKGIAWTKFEHCPGCRATLNIYTVLATTKNEKKEEATDTL